MGCYGMDISILAIRITAGFGLPRYHIIKSYTSWNAQATCRCHHVTSKGCNRTMCTVLDTKFASVLTAPPHIVQCQNQWSHEGVHAETPSLSHWPLADRTALVLTWWEKRQQDFTKVLVRRTKNAVVTCMLNSSPCRSGILRVITYRMQMCARYIWIVDKIGKGITTRWYVSIIFGEYALTNLGATQMKTCSSKCIQMWAISYHLLQGSGSHRFRVSIGICKVKSIITNCSSRVSGPHDI